MLSDGLFTALLLLISGVSVETVPSPTNVNVNCHNLTVTVSWEYSNEQPQTIFRVEIISSDSRRHWNTTDHQYDLTEYIWKSQDRYMDNYHVTITAIQGEKESGAVISQTFSFNNLKTTSLKCILEFPHVNLNEKDSGATVNFMNPYHHYKELKQALKSDSASFTFTVTSDAGDQTFDCPAKQENCKHEVTFPEGVKKCVSLKGFLGAPDYIGSVWFNKTDVCVTESTEIHVITLVTLLSVLVFIIAALIICICKAKAWTMDTPSLPKCLLLKRREQDSTYDEVPITVASVDVLPQSYEDSSVSSEEENSPTENLQDRSAGSDFEHSASLYEERGLSDSRNQDQEAAGLLSEGQRTDDDSVKTECVSIDLEEEEEKRSPYDRRHNVQLDIGDGDVVTGYTGR